ncbi:MAG: glycosyltransferase family 2 protein [bacterium]|nr:glycosyltransferase family 2 protein [bacterium]
MPTVCVAVPCFNEEGNVGRLLTELTALRELLHPEHLVEFVLVDDGSTDRTRAALLNAFQSVPLCTVVSHDENQGIAAAIMTGFQHAHADVVCSIDSDCTYDPRQLEKALPLLTPDIDVLTASPYHEAGTVHGAPPWRIALSRMASRAYRLLMRQKLSCYTSCFRVYRRDAVAELELRHPRFVGIAETLWRLDRQGARIAEWPADLTTRVEGNSKMRLVRTTWGHLQLMSRIFVTNTLDVLFRKRVPLGSMHHS